jgi:uncharacterized membrane protein YeaQ/YmgE (transglycosylase-associated protein family)
MAQLAWIVLGLMAGFVASKIVKSHGSGIVLDLVLGVVGALVGGYVFSRFRPSLTHDLNIYGALAALTGAALVLFINHRVRRAFADRLT